MLCGMYGDGDEGWELVARENIFLLRDQELITRTNFTEGFLVVFPGVPPICGDWASVHDQLWSRVWKTRDHRGCCGSEQGES